MVWIESQYLLFVSIFFHRFHALIVNRSKILSLNVKLFWTLFNVQKFLFHFQINESTHKNHCFQIVNFSASENFSFFSSFLQNSALTLRKSNQTEGWKNNKKTLKKNSHRWKQNDYSPTTSKSLVAMSVWNDGASADTSQLYFPETDGCTWASDTWLSFDPERCNETKTKSKQFYQKKIINRWSKNQWERKNSTTKTPNTKPIKLRIHKMFEWIATILFSVISD